MSMTNSFLLDSKVLLGSVSFFTGILLVNIFIPILPVSGFTFSLLALVAWFVPLCVTFVGLHKLLLYKEPISSTVFQKYWHYVGVSVPDLPKQGQSIKVNPESIKRLTLDIDKYFISKWYCFISADPEFTVESKAFLEDVLTRLMDVVLQVDNRCLLHGSLNIFLKHLKEFRRSLKRKEKYNVGIEELYRYSHHCSISGNKKTKDYFIHQLTISLLQHFINSELWNSLPCHVLVSIIARKLIRYLLNILSNPEVLNYIILNSLATNEVKQKLKLDQYSRISIVEFFDVVESSKSKESGNAIPVVAKESNAVVLIEDKLPEKAQEMQKKVEEAAKQYRTEGIGKAIIQEKHHKETVVLRQRGRHATVDSPSSAGNSPKRSNPVKIYEPKNTVRTWRDSRDLACVSLGQDPLDSLAGLSENVTKSNIKQGFWDLTAKSDDNKRDSPPSASHLFNEVMHMTSMEGLKTSIKPFSDATERTLHNIKDLQETTMNNALHKIGDFQVTDITDKKQIELLNYLHYLPPNTLLHSSVLSNTQSLLYAQPEDEAAGVVEGILDFGRAGFRKGLRLTGLQDNIEPAKTAVSANSTTAKNVTKSVREQVKKKLEELKRIDSESQEKTSSAESAESVWINPLQIDSPNYDGQILLEKAPLSKPEVDPNPPPRIEDVSIPSISTEEASSSESPDPEYEDTADLASSIAKLRSLLQQRSSESSLSTPALSPMPDEYMQKQLESENTSDVEALEVDGVMPSFYKFCTKTASGVFSNTINTIKTALPGSTAENVFTVELWKFTVDPKESETLIRMKKLLSERKEYCILDKEIDTAYDALDSVDIYQQSPILISNLRFEDELDDFESKIPITKVIIDIMCELLADTNSPLIQEPVVKAVLLVLGTTIEQKVTSLIGNIMNNLADNLITIPENTNANVLSMDIDDYIESIDCSSPDLVKCSIGKQNFKSALKLLISSLQKPKINEDVLLQGFELLAMKLIEESIQISPPASA